MQVTLTNGPDGKPIWQTAQTLEQNSWGFQHMLFNQVCIVRLTGTGNLAAIITPQLTGESRAVPAELLSLAAGRDAWMTRILLPCRECGAPTRAGDLVDGFHCAGCYEEISADVEETV